MGFLKSRVGAVRLLSCPDVIATAPDGYTDPLVIDSNSAGIFFGADWIAPTLTGGWSNYGGGNAPAGYRKVGDMVQIRGLVAGGTIGSTNVFVLPAGYRPPGFVLNLAQASNAAFGLLNISGFTGAVVAQVGSNAWFSIDCQFSITP